MGSAESIYVISDLKFGIGIIAAVFTTVGLNAAALGSFWPVGIFFGIATSFLIIPAIIIPLLIYLRNNKRFKVYYVIPLAGVSSSIGLLVMFTLFGQVPDQNLLSEIPREFFAGVIGGSVFWLITVGLKFEPDITTSNKSLKNGTREELRAP